MILTLKLNDSVKRSLKGILNNTCEVLEDLGIQTSNIKLPKQLDLVDDNKVTLGECEFFESVSASVNFKISKKQALKIRIEIDNILDALDLDLGQRDTTQIAEVPIHTFKSKVDEAAIRRFNDSRTSKNAFKIWLSHKNFWMGQVDQQPFKLAIVEDDVLSFVRTRAGDEVEVDGVRQPSFQPSNFRNINKSKSQSKSVRGNSSSPEVVKTKTKKKCNDDDIVSTESNLSSDDDGRNTKVRKVRRSLKSKTKEKSTSKVRTPSPFTYEDSGKRPQTPKEKTKSHKSRSNPEAEKFKDVINKQTEKMFGPQKKVPSDSSHSSESEEEPGKRTYAVHSPVEHITLDSENEKEKDLRKELKSKDNTIAAMQSQLNKMEDNLKKQIEETRRKVEQDEKEKFEKYKETIEQNHKKLEEKDKQRFDMLNQQFQEQQKEMDRQRQEMRNQQEEFQRNMTMFMSCLPPIPTSSTGTGPPNMQTTETSNLGIGQGNFNPNSIDPAFFTPPGTAVLPQGGTWDWRQMRHVMTGPRPPIPQPFGQGGGLPTNSGPPPAVAPPAGPPPAVAPPAGPPPAVAPPAGPPPSGAAPQSTPSAAPGTVPNSGFPVNLSQFIPTTSGAPPPVPSVPASTAPPPPAGVTVTEPPITPAPTGPPITIDSPLPGTSMAGAAAMSTAVKISHQNEVQDEICSVSSTSNENIYEDIASDERETVEKVLSRSRQGKADPFKSTTESDEEQTQEFFFENIRFECNEEVHQLLQQMRTAGDQDASNAVRLIHSYVLENKHRGNEEHFRDTLIFILTKATGTLSATHLSYNTHNKIADMAKEIGQLWRSYHDKKSSTRKISKIYDNNVQLLVSYGFADKPPPKEDKSKQTRRKRTTKTKSSDNTKSEKSKE